MKPTLFIFSGLPGAGKSTLARLLAERVKAAYFRIDTIEQGLRDLCSINVQGEGYRLTYRIIKDNLELGIDVVSDSCNPWVLTRDEWEQVASDCGSKYVNIEIQCSDQKEHQRRIEERTNDIDELKLPDWEEVQKRKYHKWDRNHITIDTANRSIEECMDELIEKLNKIAD